MGKPVKSAQDRQWEVEDAMRTLQRAEVIQKDKALMGAVKKSITTLNNMVCKPKKKK